MKRNAYARWYLGILPIILIVGIPQLWENGKILIDNIYFWEIYCFIIIKYVSILYKFLSLYSWSYYLFCFEFMYLFDVLTKLIRI